MPSPTSSNLIDVVDSHDREIGTVPRGAVLERGENFRTAHVFVFDRHGDLLLQRLAPERPRHPDRWGSSVAAYLFAGESYAAAAQRRLYEELEVDAPIREVGKLEMLDERSLKFVTLFFAYTDHPRIGVPTEISALAFRSTDWIEKELARAPGLFTPTFAALFERFGRSLD
jgi:16S rRNA (adenine1518-N6/adenine1519-N6)-dimethyltransferase